MALYHSEIYVPESVRRQFPALPIALKYSYHAIEASTTDRYGSMPQLNKIDPAKATVIEAETDNGKLIKLVYRTRLNNFLDVCVVVLIATGFVKTVWFNAHNDQHVTLNTFKYAVT